MSPRYASLNGHVTNPVVQANPDHSQDHCRTCGSRTITACEACQTKIRGHYHHHRVAAPYHAPSFCHHCGKPYPWTSARIETAKSLADEISELNENEKLLLKASIDDIVTDTPKTEAASIRFRRLLAKAEHEVGSALRKIVVDVASEAAKKSILGP